MAMFRACAAAGGFDELMSGHASQVFRERHGNGFGKDEAMRVFEVLAHYFGVDFQGGEHFG